MSCRVILCLYFNMLWLGMCCYLGPILSSTWPNVTPSNMYYIKKTAIIHIREAVKPDWNNYYQNSFYFLSIYNCLIISALPLSVIYPCLIFSFSSLVLQTHFLTITAFAVILIEIFPVNSLMTVMWIHIPLCALIPLLSVIVPAHICNTWN